MRAEGAAGIVRAMADSVEGYPSQFHFEVNITGVQAVSHGGIGMLASAVGGGPGSTPRWRVPGRPPASLRNAGSCGAGSGTPGNPPRAERHLGPGDQQADGEQRRDL